MYQSPMRAPLIKGRKTYQSITSDILNPMMQKAGKFWYLGMTVSTLAMVFGLYMIFWTVWQGIGTWGENCRLGL
jgi:hypothetical protein